MNTVGNKKFAATVAAVMVAMGAAAFGSPSASAQAPVPPGFPAQVRHEGHPALRQAMRALMRTAANLRRASRDFGGHRAQAAALCEQAEQQVRLAMQYDNH